MDKNIKLIQDKWYKNEPCSEEQLTEVENLIMKKLPQDYKDFLLWSNGGEGYIGKNYFSLWRIEDMIQLNIDYSVQKYLSQNCWAFGTDGGDICYGYNYSKNCKIFYSPLGDLDPKENRDLAESLDEFISKAIKYEFFP